MFKINPDDIRGTDNKLLYNIWQELKRLGEPKPEPARPGSKATKGKAEKPKFYRKCKKCGEEFDNYGRYMGHMKAHKKEE